MKTNAFLSCSVFALVFPLSAAAAGLQINIDHSTKSQTLSGATEVARGEEVVINIEKTNKFCFTYNATQVARTPEAETKGISTLTPDTVEIRTTHQRSTISYNVKIEKRQGNAADCAEVYKVLSEGTWSIPVTTVGWDLQLSAGAVVDGLTDRKYFLESGTTGQYTVRQDSSARDRTNQRLGVFAHLVNAKRARDSDFTWVPISFGLGFDDKARYMLGTSMKIGEQWFITAGGVSGKTATLPVGVSEGMNTTNQNLLATPGQRSSTSWFVSVSFIFLGDRAKGALEGLFPAPAKK